MNESNLKVSVCCVRVQPDSDWSCICLKVRLVIQILRTKHIGQSTSLQEKRMPELHCI